MFLVAKKVRQITDMFIKCNVIYQNPNCAQRSAIFQPDFENNSEKKKSYI